MVVAKVRRRLIASGRRGADGIHHRVNAFQRRIQAVARGQVHTERTADAYGLVPVPLEGRDGAGADIARCAGHGDSHGEPPPKGIGDASQPVAGARLYRVAVGEAGRLDILGWQASQTTGPSVPTFGDGIAGELRLVCSQVDRDAAVGVARTDRDLRTAADIQHVGVVQQGRKVSLTTPFSDRRQPTESKRRMRVAGSYSEMRSTFVDNRDYPLKGLGDNELYSRL